MLFAERDEQHHLVPIGVRFPKADGTERKPVRFLSQKELGIPDAAYTYHWPHMRPTGEFVHMYWQLWRERGLTPEQIMERWKTYKG